MHGTTYEARATEHSLETGCRSWQRYTVRAAPAPRPRAGVWSSAGQGPAHPLPLTRCTWSARTHTRRWSRTAS